MRNFLINLNLFLGAIALLVGIAAFSIGTLLGAAYLYMVNIAIGFV